MPESYKEDGRPAQQWYWDDWFSSHDVQSCSFAAQGLWINLLGIMFTSEIRGTLTINGIQMDNNAIAKRFGDSITNINKMITELEEARVFSRLSDGTIISRRMYRESKKKKQISQIRSEAGKKGMTKRWQKGNNKKITKITAPSPSSSPTPTVTPKDIHIQQIIEHWNSKNIKNLEDRESKIKKKTISKITKWLKDYSSDEIIEAIDNYDSILKSEKHFFSYKWQLCDFMDRGLTNFFSKNKPFENYLEDKRKPQTRQEIEDQKKKDWANKED